MSPVVSSEIITFLFMKFVDDVLMLYSSSNLVERLCRCFLNQKPAIMSEDGNLEEGD